MNVCVYPNGDLAAIAAAVLIAGQVVDKPGCVLGLATGSTPLPIYRELIAMSHRGVLDFSKVTTYNLDEYVGLGPDHPCSYRRFMQENLFSQINLPADHIHIPNGLAEDKDEECHNYDAAIAAAGQIDLQLLGLGANGHIGFNEPAAHFTTNSYCGDAHPCPDDGYRVHHAGAAHRARGHRPWQSGRGAPHDRRPRRSHGARFDSANAPPCNDPARRGRGFAAEEIGEKKA